MITTKISIKPHLVEYICSKYGNDDGCVRLPDRHDIYHTIWDLTEKRPQRCRPDAGNIEIVLPDRSVGKSPKTYNYLSEKSQKIIQRRVENMFFAELHDFVLEEKHRNGTPYIEAIHIFMCKYVINSISEDALKKSCYRYIQKMRIRKKRGYNRKEMLPS